MTFHRTLNPHAGSGNGGQLGLLLQALHAGKPGGPQDRPVNGQGGLPAGAPVEPVGNDSAPLPGKQPVRLQVLQQREGTRAPADELLQHSVHGKRQKLAAGEALPGRKRSGPAVGTVHLDTLGFRKHHTRGGERQEKGNR